MDISKKLYISVLILILGLFLFCIVTGNYKVWISSKDKIQDDSDYPIRHTCECGRAYNQRKYLTFHKRWECGQILECSLCFRSFNSKSYFNSHIRKFHTQK